MKHYLLIFTLSFGAILTLAPQSTHAQDGFTIKLYQNTDFTYYKRQHNNRFDGSTILLSSTEINFSRISAAGSWTGKSNWINEVEVSFFNGIPPVSKTYFEVDPDFSTSLDNFFVSLSFEKSKIIIQKGAFTFLLGGALSPYWQLYKDSSSNLNDQLDYRENNFGLNLFFIPRIMIALTDKLSFDMNARINALNVNYQDAYFDNPQLPQRQRRTLQLDRDVFPETFTIRMGLVYRF